MTVSDKVPALWAGAGRSPRLRRLATLLLDLRWLRPAKLSQNRFFVSPPGLLRMTKWAFLPAKTFHLSLLTFHLVLVRRSTPLITLDAPCGSAISWRLGKVRLWRPLLSPVAKLHAANGETVRTAVVVLGVHAATAEVQVRAVHTRSRARRATPRDTVRAHIVQAAGIAEAATRSGVEANTKLQQIVFM